MIYQQIALVRLAHAAKNLDRDGQWHPFGDDGRTFYRVSGKRMQKIRLDEDEDPALLSLFDDIHPLPARVSKEGFREEIHISISDDVYKLSNMWLRAYIGWEDLAAATNMHGGALSYRSSNSLEFTHTMDEFNQETFMKALLLGKAVSMVGHQLAEDGRIGVPHIPAEVKGLLTSAYTVLLEDIKPLKGSTGKADDTPQHSLFG
jgi:hypothetical protein